MNGICSVSIWDGSGSSGWDIVRELVRWAQCDPANAMLILGIIFIGSAGLTLLRYALWGIPYAKAREAYIKMRSGFRRRGGYGMSDDPDDFDSTQ